MGQYEDRHGYHPDNNTTQGSIGYKTQMILDFSFDNRMRQAAANVVHRTVVLQYRHHSSDGRSTQKATSCTSYDIRGTASSSCFGRC